jgi:hypothetical protein
MSITTLMHHFNTEARTSPLKQKVAGLKGVKPTLSFSLIIVNT